MSPVWQTGVWSWREWVLSFAIVMSALLALMFFHFVKHEDDRSSGTKEEALAEIKHIESKWQDESLSEEQVRGKRRFM